MSPVDLEPAARRLADLLSGIPDELLDVPTPCPDYTLGDLVDHLGGTALAFTGAAIKDIGESTAMGPSGDASRLTDDWRTRIPRDLIGMAEAWRDPAAWTGMTRAGGIELPGDVAGLVALDELVIHGWDVARATGQDYDVDAVTLEAVMPHLTATAAAGPVEGLFAAAVPIAEDAPALDRAIALSGRDPSWRTN
jgi:uncharacterized protein (TIGR03086 family)